MVPAWLAALVPPPVNDPDEVRALADEILSDRRYDRPPKPIVDRILEWFGDQLGRFLGSVVGSGAGALIAWAVVIGAIALVVYLVVRYGRVGTLPAIRTPTAEVMIELTRTPAEWRAEAAALEAEGRWREALRCRYRALIGDLVARGTIPDRAGRTSGEYLSDVRHDLPDAAVPMATATELFEAVWYGGATSGPAEAGRFEDLERQVLAVRVDR